ncbi:OmpA family protein [Phenylobacterium sp. RIFCSPHIGHO2_01_FULL_69_31]|uniref:OmpA family protein n=1 Tax=Phenylobacterium sp. RIFCSPHIGHO2_01_FULL_69_31 TaxID=1801944 RepID=UPI000AF62922|nr:OmpA family protein [Phenylobacterium sp. RIFCSPHIGHO2_01_FULL_69_31]
MRLLPALALAGLLGGCATSDVTLLNDAGTSTSGSVAVFDPKTGREVGALTSGDTRARVGGRAVKARPAKQGFWTNLMAWSPFAPRAYVMYFVEGSTDLTPESLPILEALRQAAQPDDEVQITGHTDTTGADEVNDKLSFERAVEIRAALVKQGLPFENAKVVGRGERELRVPTDDNVAEPANRRVEVILR